MTRSRLPLGFLLVGLLSATVPLFGLQLLYSAPAAAATPLIGTFTITAGSCSGGTASGTYLRMVLSGGTNAAGPYFSNSNSTCSDNTYTPLSPGTAGGLVTGTYQPEPSPAFDSSGDALADSITAPVTFEGVRFSTATNPIDPQTGLQAPAPSIAATGSALSGNLEAFGVSWNNQQFNQGSPKPGGSSPGNTTPVTGTYDSATGAYVLQWSSQVVGGPFNGFSAFWNLTGRFVPAAGQSLPTPGSSSSGSPGAGASPGVAAARASGTSVGVAGTTPGAGTAAPPTTADSGSANVTTTTVAKIGAASAAARDTRVVLSSHTVVDGGGRFNVPTWLVILVTLFAVAGLVGVLLSERALRRLKFAVTE